MDCRDVQNLLPAYSDAELDLVRHLQIEHHLAECTECADSARNLRHLRDTVSSAPYYRAPDTLRAKLQGALAPAPVAPAVPILPARRRRQMSGRLFATAAGIAILAGALTAGVFLSRGGASAENRLTEQVVAGHARSLQVAHLKDVPSSDRHTVKPWLTERLDFSPQVPDLSSHGYPLSGGRLDYLADRPVAALVYHRRQHVINLFTWPATDDAERPVRALQRQGFHIRSWQKTGMTYWTISDLNAEELDTFVQLFRESATTSP